MAGGYVWREPASASRLERLQTPCSSWIIQLHGRSGVQVLKVPAGEFQRNIGRYQDMALTQPVAVTRNGRERTVLISADEYQRLKRRDRQVITLSDFTEADIAALEATRAPESSKAFDPELQQ
jgi:prevent-host-death family protein